MADIVFDEDVRDALQEMFSSYYDTLPDLDPIVMPLYLWWRDEVLNVPG